MSLEEEIAIYRFGQGVGPIDGLVAQFGHFEELDKQTYLSEFQILLVYQVKSMATDVDQAITDSSLDPADPACVMLKTSGWNMGAVHLPQDKLDQVYVLYSGPQNLDR